MKTLIIGGVAAGASAAARLRRLDESMEIVLLERGRYISYANCGLPYHLGGVIPERDSLFVMPEKKFKAWFLSMLEQGIYLAPSPFETLFMSYAHSEDDLDRTISAARIAMKEAAEAK